MFKFHLDLKNCYHIQDFVADHCQLVVIFQGAELKCSKLDGVVAQYDLIWSLSA